MKNVLFFSINIILALLFSTVAYSSKNMVVVVYPNSEAELKWIAGHGGGIEEYITETGGYRIYIPQVFQAELIKHGVSYDVLIDDVKGHARNLMANPNNDKFTSKAPVVLDHYLTYAEMQTFLTDLESTYGNIMSVSVIATSGSGNYDLYLIKISDNVAVDEDEPELFFEGQIHGNEIAGYILNLHMIEYLVTNYGTDPDVTALVDNRELFFLPATNSDGAFSTPRSRYNINGVDCNRDSGYMWHHAGGSLAPYGENETKVLFHMWRENQFVFHTSWHSGTVAFLYAWSCHLDPTADHAEHDYLGENYCDLNTTIDTYFQGSGLYGNPYHGSTKDSAYGGFGAHGWTIELTNNKEPDWSITETSINANTPSLLWLMEEAGYGIKGIITDSSNSEPIAAVIDIDGKWVAYNDPAVGDLHRYLRPGTYNITIWANGYAPAQLSDIIVSDSSATDISTTLDPDETFGHWATKWLYNFSGNDEVTPLLTKNTLGPPDDHFFSIGFAEDYFSTIYDAYVVFDLGPDGITDNPGDDLFVYESHTDGDETIKVYGAVDPIPSSWTLFGVGTGDCSFDISAKGLGWVRYIKIEDQSPPISPGAETQYDGYDLDALGKPFNGGDDDDDDDDDDSGDDDDDDDNEDSGDDDVADQTDDDDDVGPLKSSSNNDDNIGGCCG